MLRITKERRRQVKVCTMEGRNKPNRRGQGQGVPSWVLLPEKQPPLQKNDRLTATEKMKTTEVETDGEK